ncbi:MAG: tetratricopeptide repeat protein [Acidobacteriota bacterium]|nr:MAG: tetratricopeptide repeat protein [Acidobacteriota bacterium]
MNKKILWVAIVILVIAAAAAWWVWKCGGICGVAPGDALSLQDQEEHFVIAVAPFWGSDAKAVEEGRAVQRLAEKTLREELGAEEGVAILAEEAEEPPRTEEEARNFGEALQADIVVWGHVFLFQEGMEIRPYFTTLAPFRWLREKERSVEVLFAPPEEGGVKKTEVDELRNVALLVAAAYYQDMPDKALRLLQKIEPPTADSLHWQGNIYYILENWEEAEGLFEKSLALVNDERYGHLRPEDAALLSDFGWVYYYEGKYEEALAKFQEAVELDPEDIEAHNGMGDIYYIQRRYKEAAAELWKAIALEPENPEPHNSLGWVYCDQSEFGAAISEFRKVVEFDPKHADAHTGLAWVYYHQGEYEKAVAEFETPVVDPAGAEHRTAIEAVYGDVYLGFAYSLALLKTGREEEARAHMKEVARMYKGIAEAEWPAPIARFYAGEAAEEKVLEAAESDDEEIGRRQKCEAYYYMGTAHLLGAGAPSDAPLPEREKKARGYFEKCLSTGATITPEYRSAERELKQL